MVVNSNSLPRNTQKMEGEISTFIMVWAIVFTSVTYCYFVAQIAPRGFVRLAMFFPVICLFVVLPFSLHSVHLGCPTVFFISWLANSKLILLGFGSGPFSTSPPSLNLLQFVFITCFPVKLQEKQVPNGEKLLRDPFHFASRAVGLAILVYLGGQWRDGLDRNIVLFCVTMYIYVGLDLMLSVAAFIGEMLLGVSFEAPFNHPLESTSLRDFWGRRWNKIASENLRTAVFWPVYNYLSSNKMGQKWALARALIATFLVSALIHELLMFYLGRTLPTFRTTMFFIFHGLCLVIEAAIKRKFTEKWAHSLKSKVVSGPLIFGFVVITAMWLLVPDMMDSNVHARVVEEWSAFGIFLKDLGNFLEIRKLPI